MARKSTEQKEKEARVIRLKELIANYNMTQAAFAASLDMKPTELSGIINGRRNLTEFIANKIALTYGISPKWLLHGEGDKYNPTAPTEESKQSEQQKLIADIEGTISTLTAQLLQLKQTL